jgi:hypothetical protein
MVFLTCPPNTQSKATPYRKPHAQIHMFNAISRFIRTACSLRRPHTIEEAVVIALERQSALARGLLGDEGADTSAAQLSQAEMCELLAYNRLPETEATDRSTMVLS